MTNKQVIQKIWETHYWYRNFLEKFIEGQREFYDELYQGKDYVIIYKDYK